MRQDGSGGVGRDSQRDVVSGCFSSWAETHQERQDIFGIRDPSGPEAPGCHLREC